MSLAQPPAQPPALADGLPGVSPGVYNASDFHAVAEIIYAEAGIVLAEGKAMLVYSRLAPLVRRANCGTFANFIARVRENDEDRARMVAALTTNHTFFYREAHHFEHFGQAVRPGLVGALARGEAVRIWSAGCSSGEETWSLVMTLLGPERQAGLDLARRNVRVLASDIADHALARAEAATYPARDMAPVPEALRQAWTRPAGDNLALADEARAIVRLRHLNLQGDWPMHGRFQVIFCRNVMIYFDNPTKERLVERFAHALAPGGHLYIGHSERVTGPAAALLPPVGPTIYRRNTA
ncbi:CheR family methyltransferase [Novosphingobium bradum]|uniref:Chemotaxis protein methyltransferase n=1 Tax=Novosphingobium bradum TaxID=1737444 RepID=A0ABV7IJZ3_9SPHN